MIINRFIQKNIEHWLFKGKVIILHGARQVGKTTLVKELNKKYGNDRSYINCEDIITQKALEIEDPIKLRLFLGEGNFFILDEAQKIKNIGIILKLLIDTYPELQIIATGSSSFDLANKVNEPLTGRSMEFLLYPISYGEMVEQLSFSKSRGQVDTMLIYGSYPEIIKNEWKEADSFLKNISSNYLYKDVLEFESLRKPKLLINLLQLLAFQVGNEVSINELSVKLECSKATVDRYIDLLEKAYVIFRLTPLSRNPRNEIGKKNKIYFYDLGIRNSLINNFNPISARNDIGALWENFCIVERKKALEYGVQFRNLYFWRSLSGKEVDYIEEYSGKIFGYEFKWKDNKIKAPKQFLETYQDSSFEIITNDNADNFLLGK